MNRVKEVPIEEVYMPMFNRVELIEDNVNHLMRAYSAGTEVLPIPVVENVIDMSEKERNLIPKGVKYLQYGGNHRKEAQDRLGRTTVQIVVHQPKTMLEMIVAGAKDNNNVGPLRPDDDSLRLQIKNMLERGMTTKAIAKVFHPTSIKEIANTVVSQIAKTKKLAADEYRDKHDGCTMKEAAEACGLTEKQYSEYRDGQNEKTRKGTKHRIQGTGGSNPAKDDNARIGAAAGGIVRSWKLILKNALVEWSVEHRDGKSVVAVCDRIDECAATLQSATDQVRKRVALTEAATA